MDNKKFENLFGSLGSILDMLKAELAIFAAGFNLGKLFASQDED